MSNRIRAPLRAALVVIVVVLGLALGGAVFEVLASTIDARLSPPGRLVDVGAHRLHLHCEGAGVPTVLFEAGGGNSSVTFRPLMRALAGETRVCAYDRAGYGYSSPVRADRDARLIATELVDLLERAGEAGPYLVVAHSMGGLYALALLDEHPEVVAGVALVDVIPPTYLVPLPDPLASSIGLFDMCRSGLARVGLWRLLGALEASSRDLLDTIPEVPTVVMVAGARSADDWPPDDARWRDAQRALAGNAPGGRVVVIDGDHYLQLEHTERVASEITALLDLLRR